MSTDQPSGDSEYIYRNYDHAADHVRRFYEANHANQTLAFARGKRAQYARLDHARMGIWEACLKLDELVDESDPDTELTQIQHCLQTSEAIRRDGHPDWFVLAGLVHDLGKILVAFGEPQWAVTGDTFVLGCAFPDAIVHHDAFAPNPDLLDRRYQSELGVYGEGCGLGNVTLSWGHDEYMYLVARDYLPDPALYMIRYHSFYPGHTANVYDHLLDEHDREMLAWVREFNRYDLYTKQDAPADVAALAPYYQEVINRYFPETVSW